MDPIPKDVSFDYSLIVIVQTGKPKCMEHSSGVSSIIRNRDVVSLIVFALQGVELKVKADMVLQHDIRARDVVFQYITVSPDRAINCLQDC